LPLSILCNAFILLSSAQKKLDELGSYKQTVKGGNGYSSDIPIPEIAIIKQQSALILQLSAKFGLTPRDFKELKLIKAEEDDPFKKLMDDD
jgi:phage terminase small subunit